MKITRLTKLIVLTMMTFFLMTAAVYAEDESDPQSMADQIKAYTSSFTTENITAKIYEYSILSMDGTSREQVTEINNAADLKAFAESVNRSGMAYSGITVNLRSDIAWDNSAEWTPIKKFNGTFNGNGHTITDLGKPLFRCIGKTGTVSGLSMKGDINADGNVGSVAMMNLGTIAECTFDGKIKSADLQGTSTMDTGCGGIVGINTGIVKNCSTAQGSSVSRTGSMVGGIVGLNLTMNDSLNGAGIFGCTNKADVRCVSGEGPLCGSAAGIAGAHLVYVDAKDIPALGSQVKDCVNYGSVECGGSVAGGIIGIASDAKIEGCTNYGNITQNVMGLWSAGIVGSMDQRMSYKLVTDKSNLIYVKSCVNHGTIKGLTRVGGIIGGDEPFSGINYLGFIENCVNTGDIESTGFTGGISGYNRGTITQCINTGSVSTDIRGISKFDGESWNAGGGIAAKTFSSIKECINIGTVTITVDEPLTYSTATGGIAGVSGGGDITDCYSSAPVYGNHINSVEDGYETVYYGGIVGENYSSGEITGCSFRSDAEGTLARRETASILETKGGLSISEMTGSDPSDAMKALTETGVFEYAENVTVDGTEYMLTPVLAGMPTLYSLAPETVLANAAYAIPEDNSMESFFVDVPADAYYYDAVLWAAKNGIASGIDETHFAPDADCTRAQAVTFLWRAAGSPAPESTTMPFSDVTSNSYYTQAVLWAVENGITVGIDKTHFAPNTACTRAQATTFLWRAAGSPAPKSTTMPFSDVATNSYYAQAVLWAAENGITVGTTANTFSPADNCTRAQIVTFLYRGME